MIKVISIIAFLQPPIDFFSVCSNPIVSTQLRAMARPNHRIQSTISASHSPKSIPSENNISPQATPPPPPAIATPTIRKPKSNRRHETIARFPNVESTTPSTPAFDESSIVNSSAFIDHRNQNDLAQVHSSPSRYRRRATQQHSRGGKSINIKDSNGNPKLLRSSTDFRQNSKLPLTNKNLESLLGKSPLNKEYSKNYAAALPSTIAIDMDKYAKEQRELNHAATWTNPLPPNGGTNGEARYYDSADDEARDGNGNDDGYSDNSLEFGESNPSSEHSSDSTSLDDVCFPNYYGEIDQAGDHEKTAYQWPDLNVLEEFIKEEIEKAASEDEFFSAVNFQPDIVHHEGTASPDEPSERTPLIDNIQSNEAASVSLLTNSVRIRPTPIQPWEMQKDKQPMISKKSLQPNFASKYNQRTGRIDGELCRYTYFRGDLEKTIHSTSLSGLILTRQEMLSTLLQEDDGIESKSIFERLQDLFQPTHYSGKLSSMPSSVNLQQDTNLMMAQQPPTLAAPSTANLNVWMTDHKTPSRGTQTPRPGTAMGSVNDVPDIGSDLLKCEPFWLDVLDPTEEEMKVLSKTFGIHPLTTEDIFLGETREKVELFKSYYFICFTSFDVVYERRKQRAKEHEKKFTKLQEMYENAVDDDSVFGKNDRKGSIWNYIKGKFGRNTGNQGERRATARSFMEKTGSSSHKSPPKKVREGELVPLNMYMIVFKDAVITFHFSATPHPINVRRRARLLKEYLTVSADWMCYALIDDITDSFAPMIETIEAEVNSIEDAILKMHSGHTDSDSDSDSDDDSSLSSYQSPKLSHTKLRRPQPHLFTRNNKKLTAENVFVWRKRSKSTVDNHIGTGFKRYSRAVQSTPSSKSSSSSSTSSRILGWKRKGDMLRRIGECRKRVMSVLRLLGSKADVIKGLSKRLNDTEVSSKLNKQEIGMYLSDIQDHIVTMVQALNHYEKLLARFHSNYLAQINIDMTKVNNDTNDVLGKITILGTIVLPINVVTGLWGMNCLVPGQDYDGLAWFWCIITFMICFSIFAYNYARRVTGL